VPRPVAVQRGQNHNGRRDGYEREPPEEQEASITASELHAQDQEAACDPGRRHQPFEGGSAANPERSKERPDEKRISSRVGSVEQRQPVWRPPLGRAGTCASTWPRLPAAARWCRASPTWSSSGAGSAGSHRSRDRLGGASGARRRERGRQDPVARPPRSRLPDRRERWIGPSVVVGELEQHRAGLLGASSVLDAIQAGRG